MRGCFSINFIRSCMVLFTGDDLKDNSVVAQFSGCLRYVLRRYVSVSVNISVNQADIFCNNIVVI